MVKEQNPTAVHPFLLATLYAAHPGAACRVQLQAREVNCQEGAIDSKDVLIRGKLTKEDVEKKRRDRRLQATSCTKSKCDGVCGQTSCMLGQKMGSVSWWMGKLQSQTRATCGELQLASCGKQLAMLILCQSCLENGCFYGRSSASIAT